MYEERRETFSVRDIILQVLLVILFILILVWIFPTKGYMRKFFNTNVKSETTAKVDASNDDIDRLAVLYNQIFANNIQAMKEAAVGYYTNERLPKNVGDTEKMTLNEMYNKHLVLKLTDKDGNACDGEKSYVSITKYDEEFQMKVNLSCGQEEDYIIVYLGCYDYCDASGVCEKQIPQEPSSSTPSKDGKPSTPSTTPSKDKTPSTPSQKKYVCEYKKYTDGKWTDYGDWSKWTTEPLTSSDTTQVETKTEKEISGYTTKKVKTGTKTETYVKGYKEEQYISGYKTEKYISGYKDEKYISGYTTEKYISGYTTEKYVSGYKTETYVKDYKEEKYIADYKEEQYISGYKTEKYISGYATQKVKTGSKKVQVGTTTKTTTVKVPAGTTRQYVSSGSGTTIPSNGNGYIYVKVGSKTSQSCSSCATKTVYTWDVYKVVTVYKTEKRTEQVPVYETQDTYETKQVPIYKTKQVPIYKTKKTPIYETKKIPVYATKKVEVYSVKKTPIYKTRSVPVYSTKKVPVYATKKTAIYSTKKVEVYGTREVDVYEEVKEPNYKTVTYYRSRTRKYIGGNVDTKWSTCDPVDQTLVSKGYKQTGKRKEA